VEGHAHRAGTTAGWAAARDAGGRIGQPPAPGPRLQVHAQDQTSDRGVRRAVGVVRPASGALLRRRGRVVRRYGGRECCRRCRRP